MPSYLSLRRGKRDLSDQSGGKDFKKGELNRVWRQSLQKVTTWQREETGHRWLIVITQGKSMMSRYSHTTLMRCPDGRMRGRRRVEDEE